MSVTLKGRYYITVFGPDGEVKDRREGDNVITTVGKEFLASYLSSGAAAASTFTARYMAIGTDTTGEAAANTALGTELARHTGTVSYISGAIYRVTATFAAGAGTGAIAEYGIFTSSTGGTLLSRDTEPVVNKGASDTLTAVFNLTLS
jgi:hypothetical protein